MAKESEYSMCSVSLATGRSTSSAASVIRLRHNPNSGFVSYAMIFSTKASTSATFRAGYRPRATAGMSPSIAARRSSDAYSYSPAPRYIVGTNSTSPISRAKARLSDQLFTAFSKKARMASASELFSSRNSM